MRDVVGVVVVSRVMRLLGVLGTDMILPSASSEESTPVFLARSTSSCRSYVTLM